MSDAAYISVRPGVSLAYLRQAGKPGLRAGRTGFIWLGGFNSDMTGSKAESLAAHAREAGRACLRFDYSGHGRSQGRFEDGTISVWLDEAVKVFLELTQGPTVVIGSSMGGYLGLLLLRRLAQVDRAAAARIKGLLLIAPAADMTENLLWAEAGEGPRALIMTQGAWLRPSAYGAPYPITRELIEDGRRHLILGEAIEVACPAHIVHGDADPDVPWQHGLKLYRALTGVDVRFTLVKGGDHRLSTPRDLAAILAMAERLAVMSDAAGAP
jgi:pimeloyl-ACP methyl ester carboxylesterase